MKYRTHETDFRALANELHGQSKSDDTDKLEPDELDKWSDYSDSHRD